MNSGIKQVPSSEGTTVDMVICSFALHLITPSELFALLWQLSTKATWLIIIAPHKKPEVNFAQFTDPITRLKWRIVDRLKMAGDG